MSSPQITRMLGWLWSGNVVRLLRLKARHHLHPAPEETASPCEGDPAYVVAYPDSGHDPDQFGPVLQVDGSAVRFACDEPSTPPALEPSRNRMMPPTPSTAIQY